MHIVGWQDNYTCDISDAYLAFHNHLLTERLEKVIIWADTDWFDIEKIDNSITEPSDTYIVANELRWRVINEQTLPVYMASDKFGSCKGGKLWAKIIWIWLLLQ